MTDITYQTCPICQVSYTTQDACPNITKHGAILEKQVHEAIVDMSDYTPVRLFDSKGKKKKGRNSWSFRSLTFDSKDEALRYGYLDDLRQAGVIRHLRVQPTMVIRNSFNIAKSRYYKSCTISAETYTPDYAYVWDGLLIIEDVKGVKKVKRTDRKTKRKYETYVPYSKPASTASQKHLLAKYQNKLGSRVLFMLVTLSKHQWQYWQVVGRGYHEMNFSLQVSGIEVAA